MATKSKTAESKPAESKPAALDAVAEVEAEDPSKKPGVTIEFRGQEYAIPRSVFSSPAFGLSIAAGQFNEITYTLLAACEPTATRRFLASCTPEDTMVSVGAEFISAVSGAAGQGNSSAS